MSTLSTSPIVSVVIPHYGGKDIIYECLESLKKVTYSNIEVIVVDNNSPDDSVEYIKINFPNIKLIISDYNRGFAGGCNYGVKNSKGKYILILNNDTTHEPDFIEYLVQKLESDKNISSVQPKIRNFSNSLYFDYAGACGGFLDKYCFPFARGRIFDTVEEDVGQYDNSCKIFWASGTAFLTRKENFNQIGGFDEVLFAHMEEIDFHWKSQILGYEVWVEPKAVIFHKGAVTLPKTSPEKTYLNFRNSMILLLTNNSKFKIFSIILPRIIFECLAFIKEIISFKWLHSFSIIRSWIWILGNLNILKKRREFYNRNKKTFPILTYNKSIIIKYFLQRKKLFSKIFF
jgi:hypothetical protein